jgi:hypothetical protein
MFRICRASLVVLCLPLVTMTCARNGTRPANAPLGMARLRIECCVLGEVFDAKKGVWEGACESRLEFAVVFIDDKDAGTCDEWGGAGKSVRAGPHHISVQHSEVGCCFSYEGDVELAPRGEIAVKAMLAPLPD